jgi:hypothetical protein
MNEVLEANCWLGASFACNMLLNVCSFGGRLMCLMKKSMPSMEYHPCQPEVWEDLFPGDTLSLAFHKFLVWLEISVENSFLCLNDRLPGW